MVEEDKSAFRSFAQQNTEEESICSLMKISDNPLAMKMYLLIVQKMDKRNALVASYDFFMQQFNTSSSSVRRAVSVLQKNDILQIKRIKGMTIYLLNPNIVWKDKGSRQQYCEFNAKIIMTGGEWNYDSNNNEE